jgi:hypothetical protein
VSSLLTCVDTVQGLLVVEHRAEIAHVEPAFMRTEIEPCQSDGHGESGFMMRYGVAIWNPQFEQRADVPRACRVGPREQFRGLIFFEGVLMTKVMPPYRSA